MLREQREGFGSSRKKNYPAKLGWSPASEEPKPRPASCSTATPEYGDSIDVSEFDFSAADY